MALEAMVGDEAVGERARHRGRRRAPIPAEAEVGLRSRTQDFRRGMVGEAALPHTGVDRHTGDRHIQEAAYQLLCDHALRSRDPMKMSQFCTMLYSSAKGAKEHIRWAGGPLNYLTACGLVIDRSPGAGSETIHLRREAEHADLFGLAARTGVNRRVQSRLTGLGLDLTHPHGLEGLAYMQAVQEDVPWIPSIPVPAPGHPGVSLDPSAPAFTPASMRCVVPPTAHALSALGLPTQAAGFADCAASEAGHTEASYFDAERWLLPRDMLQ